MLLTPVDETRPDQTTAPLNSPRAEHCDEEPSTDRRIRALRGANHQNLLLSPDANHQFLRGNPGVHPPMAHLMIQSPKSSPTIPQGCPRVLLMLHMPQPRAQVLATRENLHAVAKAHALSDFRHCYACESQRPEACRVVMHQGNATGVEAYRRRIRDASKQLVAQHYENYKVGSRTPRNAPLAEIPAAKTSRTLFTRHAPSTSFSAKLDGAV